MLTEEQKKQMDDVFNEPLSDKKPVPADYEPPVFLQGEPIQDYVRRLDKYNFQYYAGKVSKK